MRPNDIIDYVPSPGFGEPRRGGPLFDPATLITGGISLGTSLLGGLFGSSASKKAAAQQQAAIQQAQSQIQGGMRNAQTGESTGVSEANSQITNGVRGATGTLADVFGQQRGVLQPYLDAGTQGVTSLADWFKPGGGGTTQFSYSGDDLKNDPGYQFQLEQGQKATERLASAHGNLLGGGTLKSLAQFGQGLASTSYGDAYNRALKTFQTNHDNTLQGYMALAGLGQNATSQFNSAAQNYGNGTAGYQFQGGTATGGNILHGADFNADIDMDGGRSLADLFTQQGNSQAAGTVGAANAWTGALNGAGKGLAGAYQTSTLGNFMKTFGGGMQGAPAGAGTGSVAGMVPPMPYQIGPAPTLPVKAGGF